MNSQYYMYPNVLCRPEQFSTRLIIQVLIVEEVNITLKPLLLEFTSSSSSSV